MTDAVHQRIADEASAERAALAQRYRRVRRQTEQLCAPLAAEDYVIQPMPDASPAKWHLAHTSWFFETFILKPQLRDYADQHPAYAFLYNSYYVQAGARHDRNQRGMLSRPTVAETYEYRRHVDGEIERLLAGASRAELAVIAPLLELGLNHEQQHQELIVTDLKYLLAMNPLLPAYHSTSAPLVSVAQSPLQWIRFNGGIAQVGTTPEQGFCFDNETPAHDVLLPDYELASRTVTNAEYQQFIDDGGYRRAELWLSDGFALCQQNEWQAPLYWFEDGTAFTLQGRANLEGSAPVTHISYYEADAYARWAGARLPTEFEWEHAARDLPISGNFSEDATLSPQSSTAASGLADMFGNVWEWTQSHYSPYPGYRIAAGALGEYNGKFMANQFVLRGGSCATPMDHIRATYRNFFHADKRWQFSGLRLARDC